MLIQLGVAVFILAALTGSREAILASLAVLLTVLVI